MKNTILILLMALFTAMGTSAFGQVSESTSESTSESSSESNKEFIEEAKEVIKEIKEAIKDAEEELDDAAEELEDASEDLEEVEEELSRKRVIIDEDGVRVNIGEVDDADEEDGDEDYCAKDDEDRFRVLLLDYGISTYTHNGSLNLPQELNQFSLKYGGSFSLNLHLFRHRLRFGSSPVALDYGSSINWRRYKFQNDFRLVTNSPTVELDFDDVDYDVNKLRATYLEVPVMLTINPLGSKFTMSAGAFGAMKLGSSQKLKSNDLGTEKVKDDFNLRQFNYGLVGRLGFGPLEFFAQYSIDPMFNDDLDPAFNQLTFGVALLSF